MNQKPSVVQIIKSVPQVLTSDSRGDADDVMSHFIKLPFQIKRDEDVVFNHENFQSGGSLIREKRFLSASHSYSLSRLFHPVAMPFPQSNADRDLTMVA